MFADELAFAETLAARAGELLMERYERVERVDYKSARDVVTEVDHLSEELIIAAIRARYPDDGILAEESGEHVAVAGEAPSSGRAGRGSSTRSTARSTTPTASRSSACRSAWRWMAAPPSALSTIRADTRRMRRRPTDRPRSTGRVVVGLGEGQAERLRGAPRAWRAAARDPDAPDPQADSGRADDGLGGTRNGVRRAADGSTPSSRRAACRSGTSPPPD